MKLFLRRTLVRLDILFSGAKKNQLIINKNNTALSNKKLFQQTCPNNK